MAKLAVDRVVEREAREAACRTDEIPLGMPEDPQMLPRVEGADAATREHLAARYGHAAIDVLELAAKSPELARRICPGAPDIAAEAAFAARREQVRSLADVLLRRTRLGLTHARELSQPGAEGPALAAAAIAGELGWDGERVARELERWSDVAAAEGLVPAGAEEPVAAAVPAEETGKEPLREGAGPEEAR
jgi:glycerol-3-phosphate dehydrogenase